MVPFLIALALLAGSAVLGVLQWRWVEEASQAEEARIRRTLTLGAGQVRMDLEDEVRVVLSLIRLSAADMMKADWTQISQAARFWYESARFPSLLKTFYIVRGAAKGAPEQGAQEQGAQETGAGGALGAEAKGLDALMYSREEDRFLSVSVPREATLSVSASGAPPFERQQSAVLSDGSLLVVVPVYADGRAAGSVAPQPPQLLGAVAINLDSAVLYRDVLPLLMERHLPSLPYRVLAPGSGEAIVESGAFQGEASPEVEMRLGGIAPFDVRSGWSEISRDLAGTIMPSSEPGATRFLDDSLLRFWQMASGEPRDARGLDQPGLPFPDNGPVLQVFYSNGSLASVMLGRRIVNIGVSFGILAVLLAASVVLYRLYRRNVELRASEQEFVASMSHELRTPIAVIQATSENLSRNVVKDPQRLPRYARVINDQVKRLGGMVENILFYSGLQSGRPPARVEIDLPGLVQEIVQPLQQLALEHRSELRVTMESVPGTICSDAMALRLILENLLMNAIRHSGSPLIRLSLARRAFDVLRITVEDDGRGIPAREHSRVFQPFIRGESSASEQRPGSGLGLHLVKRVVTMLGGKVTLESPYVNLAEVMQPGSRFTVTLPCREKCLDG